ncbi:hypothetical protein [Ancylobacter sp.]|uniref:hypothetical protein n=1 Tax=Ancylobacter sp. TaxID=1872567 RepID=UPI003D0DF476
MTKRSEVHWRVSEFESGQPFIVMEQYAGDELDLFKKFIGFDLPDGTSLDEAKQIRDLLSRKLIRVSET